MQYGVLYIQSPDKSLRNCDRSNMKAYLIAARLSRLEDSSSNSGMFGESVSFPYRTNPGCKISSVELENETWLMRAPEPNILGSRSKVPSQDIVETLDIGCIMDAF